jgi:hypothetical protein
MKRRPTVLLTRPSGYHNHVPKEYAAMGSSRSRKSTRARKARQKQESRPPPPKEVTDCRPPMAQVQGQLGDARSLFAVATLAMDSLEEGSPHRSELTGHCDPSDVTTLLGIALVQLETAIAGLDELTSLPAASGAGSRP